MKIIEEHTEWLHIRIIEEQLRIRRLANIRGFSWHSNYFFTHMQSICNIVITWQFICNITVIVYINIQYYSYSVY